MVSALNPFFLPVADEALEKGYVELLRAGIGDKPLFVSLHRHVFDTPERWGDVLAEITLNLAMLYAAGGAFTEDAVIAAVAVRYRDFLRTYLESAKGTKPAKSARPLGKAPARKGTALARPKAKVKAPTKAKSTPKSAGKALAGRKGVRR